MGKRNILEEAISESKTLREAALSNAKVVLMDSIKDSLKESVDRQLEEAAEMEHAEPDGDECSPDDSGNMTEAQDMDDDLGLDIDEEGGDNEGDEDMMDHDDGLNGDDLSEAIAEALETISEVENPSMGDSEMVDHAHPSHGFRSDVDPKEEDWEAVDPPASKNQYSAQGIKNEQKSLHKKLTELVKENVLLKKANRKLRETVDEIRLFNSKIMYANKLIAKEGLSADTKRKIVSKMDTAKTVVEAKSIFEAFDCALGALSESAKPKSKKAPALTEVLGSNGGNKPMNREALKESVYGGAYSKERFQKLAGIKESDD